MSSNPYAPPSLFVDDGQQMPPTRAGLAAIIQSFLDGELIAFEFDEQLDEYHSTGDPVMEYVAYSLWCHYDDCDNHPVCLTKAEWDYFQRLLLLLEADCTMEVTSRKVWSVRQLVAAVALSIFLYFAVHAGWGLQLLILAMPFGLVSKPLAFVSRKKQVPADPYEPIIHPFATLSDLETAYHSVGFQKTRYPKHVSQATIRSPLMDAAFHLQFYVHWLTMSPIVLLFQALPRFEGDTKARGVQ